MPNQSWTLCQVAIATVALSACVKTVPVAEVEPPPAQSTFASRVRPILEQRCVVCHSCNNAPCQLNLQTYEGLDRGGSKRLVYDGQRLTATEPTRMFQDAKTTAEWRTRFGFFPVMSHSKAPLDSMLYHFIARRMADPRGGEFQTEQNLVCPESVPQARSLLEGRPELGMPLGFPPLDDDQFQIIDAWLSQGAPPPPAPPPAPPATVAAIGRWERFLAGDDLRSQLVARYLYEHLFLAHLHFEGGQGRDFYRLVRSRTPAPQPVDEIATARPFDDPKIARVFYRLVRLSEAIVHKTHVPFALSDARLARVRELFLAPKWTVEALPSYAPEVASNPFVAFAAIPARSRYQFLLDDAYYHVRSFIHGPVCKGQIALNVIDEHFWVMFLAPDSDVSITDPEFLRSAAEDLRLPAEGGDAIDTVYASYKLSQLSYLKKRGAAYERAHLEGRQLGDLWDGGPANKDALLTVYRHFDSASVSHGALGGIPKTAWVIDYPIFERIYYDLVAGFNVYGNVVHQLATRRYMDNLRVEGEDGFLRFMPLAERPKLQAAWYRGAGVDAYMQLANPFYDSALESRVVFRDPAHAKEEFWAQVKTRYLSPKVVGDGRVPPPVLASLADVPGPWAQLFPDVTLLRVGDQLFSLVRNRAHLNVAFMFFENDYRAPNEDTLGIVRGVIGSYPNLLIEVLPERLEQFAAEMRALKTEDDSWKRFVAAWGTRRSAKDFWSRFDWFAAAALLEEPVEGGLLDLGRYVND